MRHRYQLRKVAAWGNGVQDALEYVTKEANERLTRAGVDQKLHIGWTWIQVGVSAWFYVDVTARFERLVKKQDKSFALHCFEGALDACSQVYAIPGEWKVNRDE